MSEMEYNIDMKDEEESKMLVYGVNGVSLFSFSEVPINYRPNESRKVDAKTLRDFVSSERRDYFFRRYLRDNKKDSFLSFYKEVSEYQTCSPENQKAKATLIKERYLEEGAPLRLPLLSDELETAITMAQKTDSHTFSSLFAKVTDILVTESNRFLKTDYYPLTKDRLGRMTIRDNVGKFVWDCRMNYLPEFQLPHDITKPQSKPYKNVSSLNASHDTNKLTKRRRSESQEARNVESSPSNSNAIKSVDDLLTILSKDPKKKNDKEWLPQSIVPADFTEKVNDMARRLMKQSENDNKALKEKKDNKVNCCEITYACFSLW
eukprot:TRINITY_DN7934_c0_g1_i3.p1 TRINITY_DN7934_c0_g1~~TRINITY_DN7934_c0_g1_i3.p1  ORF type:complete len:362 (+),score=75.34 TRINITY_DN7934_c0_g1_i3:127-1086(+)